VTNADDLTADFDSHHIEGYAVTGDYVHFSVPLVSHIVGNLWTGGCIDGVRLSDDYVYVLSLYPWQRYKLGPSTKWFTYAMNDGEQVPKRDEMEALADFVIQCTSKGKTLVHCQAGLNRSALVAGLALVISKVATADEAIGLLRERRAKQVLCNPAFERWLREYEP
jgi:protein-tyrosine phosphatase